jgi:hypothetical protein
MNCFVQIDDGELIIILAPSTLVEKRPASTVEILTPFTPPQVETGVVLRLDGRLLIAVMFDTVYRSQEIYGAGR